ncbi:Fibronectin, type III domain protein [Candidatus Magnetomorum sp. HK-1]|nr:Fibronectin, type III domain protein [Candidatus Magnetomorum sp. HK-1]
MAAGYTLDLKSGIGAIDTDFIPQNIKSPSHIKKICSNNTTIDIEWNKPDVWNIAIQGYAVLWDNSPNTLPDSQITTSDTSNTSPILPEGDNYYVHIRAIDDQGLWSNIAAHLGPFCIKFPNVLEPQGLHVSNITGGRIELKWHLMGEDIFYNVYRSDRENGFYIKCDPFNLTKPEYTDSNVTGDMTYWYKISASNAQGEESLLSAPVSAQSESTEVGFQLLPFQTHQMQIAGLTAHYPIQVLPIGNYSDDVQLWVVNLHSWINYKLNKQVLSPPAFVTLELVIPDTLQAGNDMFKVVAIGSNFQVEQSLSLDIVNPAFDESTISAYIKNNQVRMNIPVQIYGSIQPSRVNASLLVYIQNESDDSPVLKETMTNNTSGYQLDFIPQQTGTYKVYAKWEGDDLFKVFGAISLHI